MSKTSLATTTTLDVNAQLSGKSFVVFGGTGFLGKVWLSLILDRYPDVGHLYLLVRAKKDQTPEQRFWDSIASSEVFQPLRDRLGEDGLNALFRQKITPIDGDVARAFCGVDEAVIEGLVGKVDAVVNVAGVVDFSPPLDEAIDVNAFGVDNLVNFTRRLGDLPLLHTSTCYVAGNRTGQVDEVDPLEFPFPRADELDRSHWSPARELAECSDLVKQAKQRVDDAFRQSAFLDEAKANLENKNEPAYGEVLADEIARVRRKFVERQLGDAGMERAQFWGWPNTYTYTKALGEQILAASGLRFTIVRPAIIESSTNFPFPGWNEGINTSAPLLYAIVEGLAQLPAGEHTTLDIVPVDQVASGMLLALAALMDNSHDAVYQCGTSDINAVTVRRLIELSSLFKRLYWDRHTKNPFKSFLMRRYETVDVTDKQFFRHGSPAVAKAAKGAASLFRGLGMKPLANALNAYGKTAQRAGDIIEVFMPFLTNEYLFSCANTRAVWARSSAADREKLYWAPEQIDWRHYWMEVHAPALEKYVFPEIKKKEKKELLPAKKHTTLVALFNEMASRHDLSVALQRLETDGLTRITYRDMHSAANAVAARLVAAGVQPKDNVLISGLNHPAWTISYFGILKAGAVAVPVDCTLDASPFANIVRTSGVKVALWDEEVEKKAGRNARDVFPELRVFDLHAFAEDDPSLEAPVVEVKGSDVASLIFTSGTTGTPKGVMLTHDNFTGLLSSIAPLFPLGDRDRTLSVLPLHHTFEFTCGMLLPLSGGARIIYLDELNAEQLNRGLQEGRVTAMVGVPALWQLLERRILSQAEDAGIVGEKYIEWGSELNRWFGKKLGVDIGRAIFFPIHQRLGGNIRYLVSGAASLPDDTQKFFAGLGLHLAEGYGLTEASPVLTVQSAGPKSRAGSVGKPIPGVEVKILSPAENGVGEVVARGKNVMLGYANSIDETNAVLDADGWLHTGDLGKFDKTGRLTIVGRAKEVIVNSSGENVYPDDVENALGRIRGVEEFAIVGVENPSGGERVGMLARPEEGEEGEERSARFDKATKAIRESIEKLPTNSRPVVIHLYDAELPKTATRKVKRTEVKKILDRMTAASTPVASDGEGTSTVRAAVARLAHKNVKEISGATRFQADLGFDSLMMMELVVSLEGLMGSRQLPDDLTRVETVGEVEAIVGTRPQLAKKKASKKADEDEEISFPEPVRDAVKSVLGKTQMAFYERYMDTRITGRAYIPQNRNAIVIANHTSHLDMGLVKYALGSYGEDIVTLAAQDYFFDDKWKKAYFENFTNLAALDRKASLTRSLRQAGEFLERGKTVLIFPEGTRSPDGQVTEFKRAFAHLALTHDVDILPLYLKGAYDAMGRGDNFPKKRKLGGHIGPVLEVKELRRLTEGMKFSDQVRRTAQLGQAAVEALRDGKVVDLRRMDPANVIDMQKREHPLIVLFRELETKFKKGAVEQPTSFYFTLGTEPEAKWNCIVSPDACVINMGKPESGTADCVLKTNPDMFRRIVREAYVPSIEEFLAGDVKSNDVSLLGTFQRAFALID